LPNGLHTEYENLEEIRVFISNKTSDPVVFKSIERIFKKYLCRINLKNNRHALLVRCPHPSARQGQWQVFKDISLPIIILYLRDKLGFNDAG